MADEQNDRIYMIGGVTSSRRQAVRYYRVSTNSWHSPTDSTTYWSVYVRNSSPKMFAADVIVIISFTCHIIQDCAAVIVGWPRSNHRRIMIVYGRNSKNTNYMWLDPESNWGSTTKSSFNTDYMKAVSLSKWEHYLMGGRTYGYHGDGSTR